MLLNLPPSGSFADNYAEGSLNIQAAEKRFLFFEESFLERLHSDCAFDAGKTVPFSNEKINNILNYKERMVKAANKKGLDKGHAAEHLMADNHEDGGLPALCAKTKEEISIHSNGTIECPRYRLSGKCSKSGGNTKSDQRCINENYPNDDTKMKKTHKERGLIC